MAKQHQRYHNLQVSQFNERNTKKLGKRRDYKASNGYNRARKENSCNGIRLMFILSLMKQVFEARKHCFWIRINKENRCIPSTCRRSFNELPFLFNNNI